MASSNGKKARKASVKGEGVKTRAKFRSSPEWKDWRLQVLERDGNRCTCCGLSYPSPRLQCHHRDMNKEKYQILDNLSDFTSLCATCHKSLHAFERKVRSKKRAFSGDHSLVELVNRFFL